MKIIVSLLFSLFSVAAIAQEDVVSGGSSATSVQDVKTEAPPVDPNEVKTLKKIEITGSYIKRVDEEGASPVQTLSGDTLKKSGYNSVADVLRDNALSSTAGEARENSLSTNPGTATAGIGAFGSDSILVLLDGNRLPKIGGGNSVDLNLIPMAAIERVDIQRDGASALYGSDAVGGVMNFITKKDYTGAAITLGQSVSGAGGANRGDFTGSFGKKFEKGSITGIYQYRQNEHLADADRPFTKITDLPLQGSWTSQQGTYIDANGVKQTPNCPAGQQDPANPGVCLFDYTAYSWNMPDITQNSLMLSGTYRVNDYINSRTQVTSTYRDVRTRLAPAPGRLNINQANMIAYGQNNARPDADLDGDGDLDAANSVQYRLLEGGGTRDSSDATLGYTIAQTIGGKIAGSWSYDVTGTYAASRARQDKRGYADKRILEQLANSGKLNPFALPGQKGDISPAVIDAFNVVNSSQREVRAVATGQIVDNISMAVGASANWQDYEERADDVTLSGNTYGDAGGSGEGKRNFQAVFQELSVFPTETFEINVAGRYDKYSDFGETFNPKLSLNWQATEKAMFRTSIGTGFRAPNLDNLYGGPGLGFPSFSDIVQCAKGLKSFCSSRQYEVSTFSNPNLKQETSIFYNAGVLLQPKKNWNVESNFFIARVEDNVGGVSGADVMRAERLYGIQGMQDRFGVTITRDPNTGELININMPSAFNAAFTNQRGVDFRISNISKANIGSFPIDFVFNVDHIQYLMSEREAFANTGVLNSRDVNWKNTVSLTGNHNDHSVRIAARTISGGDKAGNENEIGVVGFGSLRTHTEFDLNYTVDKVFKKATLNVGVKNMFDTDRPLDDTAQTLLDASIYDPIGRYFYTNIGYTF